MEASSGVILLYHRINTLSPDPWTLAVTPENFSEQLAVLRELTQVQPLPTLLRSLEAQTASGKPLSAITFDDGYLDNYLQAKPLLEKADTPATVFVTAGYLSTRTELWWDALDRIFLQPGPLPALLSMQIAGLPVDGECGEPSNREALYYKLFEAIRPLRSPAQVRVIEELEQWSGRICSRPALRMMTDHELARMNDSDLIEIGAHTLTHPVLSLLSREEQNGEIMGSKQQLEQILNSEVQGFAYPNGFRTDYTNETAELVHDAGFAYACAAFQGTVSPSTDRYQLPRMMIRNWKGDEFERHLRETLLLNN